MQRREASINDLLIKACAAALKAVPEANASFSAEGIALHHHADIAVAVAIDGGLITPIIREAENRTLADISKAMKDLAERARARKDRRRAEDEPPVDIFPKDDPGDAHGRQSLEIEEKGAGCGGRAGQPKHQKQGSEDSPERDDRDHPGDVRAPQRRLGAPDAKKGAARLADRKADSGAQIEKSSHELRVARSDEQLCEWGRSPEQDG